MEILSSIVNMLACASCKAVNMKVSEMYSKKKRLASFLIFSMPQLQLFYDSYTSRPVGNSFDINTRAVYSTRACGQGYAGLGRFINDTNFSKPMTSNNYDKIVY